MGFDEGRGLKLTGKITFKTEDLKAWGLVDTTERYIAYRDRVDVCCINCNKINNLKFSKIMERTQKGTLQKPYYCLQCSHLLKDEAQINKTRQKTMIERYGVASVRHVPEVEARRQKTIRDRYGADNALQNQTVREKVKQTVKDRYGVDNIAQSPQCRQKVTKTLKDRYGAQNPIDIPGVKEKIQKTVQERYGVDSTLQLDRVQQASRQFQAENREEINHKKQQTCLANYGVDHYFKTEQARSNFKRKIANDSKEISSKRQKTNTEKYGMPFATAHPDVRAKTAKTCLEKYGKSNPSGHPDVREKQKRTCLSKYGTEFFFNSEEFAKQKKESDWTQRGKAEKDISQWITDLGILNYHGNLNGTEFDIICPEHNIAIEYNGLYWHCDVHPAKGPDYHIKKTNQAAAVQYRLVQIMEHEWRDRKEQVKSFLLSVFGLNKTVHARKCTIKINSCDKKLLNFVNMYHIQPTKNCKQAISLEYNGELIAVALFGSHHRQSEKLVLSRFVTKTGYTVVGGLSKISKAASKHFGQDIISWCDLRWSEGNGYRQAGWTQDAILPPDYSYTNLREVFSKQSRRKSAVGTPDGMTEREHAQIDGLARIWDCGKIRFVYKFKPT